MSRVGPAFFDGSASGSGGATEAGLLAGFTTSLWGAYGLSKLSSLYTGNAIRVRRSSDSTEEDIGFSGTALDTTSLATFVGSDDAFITKWYDQSRAGNDLAQATAANQPKICDAGTYLGEMLFDGSNDYLSTANSSGTPTAFSVHLAGRNRLQGATTEVMVRHNAANANAMYSHRDTTQVDDYVGIVQLDGSTLCGFDNALTNDATTYGFCLDRSLSVGFEGALYVNGSAKSTVATSGTNTTGSFSAATWTIGSTAGSNPSLLACRTLLIYETAQSSGTFASIATLIKPAAPTLGLDSFTANLWGVYSLRKQLTAYAGSAIRVRRSSDNTEQDIGFSSNLLDTASLLTFTGAGSAFIKTWYDQSGNGHDLSQSTTADQPRIVNAGVVDVGVTFDGTNDLLSSGNSGTPSAFTAFFKGETNTSATSIILEQTTNDTTQTGCALLYGSTHVTTVVCTQTSSSNQARSDYTANAVSNVICARWDRSQLTAAAQTVLFSGGIKLTRSGNSDAGTLPSGNFSAAAWFLGARSGATFPTNMNMESLVIYETAVSDANVDRISRRLG